MLLLLKISYLCFSMCTSLIALVTSGPHPDHCFAAADDGITRMATGKYLTRISGGGRHFRILSSSNLQLYSSTLQSCSQVGRTSIVFESWYFHAQAVRLPFIERNLRLRQLCWGALWKSRAYPHILVLGYSTRQQQVPKPFPQHLIHSLLTPILESYRFVYPR